MVPCSTICDLPSFFQTFRLLFFVLRQQPKDDTSLLSSRKVDDPPGSSFFFSLGLVLFDKPRLGRSCRDLFFPKSTRHTFVFYPHSPNPNGEISVLFPFYPALALFSEIVKKCPPLVCQARRFGDIPCFSFSNDLSFFSTMSIQNDESPPPGLRCADMIVNSSSFVFSEDSFLFLPATVRYSRDIRRVFP